MSASRPAPDALAPEALVALAQRWAGARPAQRAYARWKLRLDPVYGALVALAPAGARVVDVGAGLGLLAVALAAQRGAVAVLAIEPDPARAAAARAAAAGLPVEVLAIDARTASFPTADLVALVDVLHLVPEDDQDALVDRAAGALAPGGLVAIRETDGGAARGLLTRAVERASVRVGFSLGARPAFRRPEELLARLAARGLTVERRRLASRLLPGNVLLLGRRDPQGGRATRALG